MTERGPFKRRMSPENLKKLREAQRAGFHKAQAAKHGAKKRDTLGERLPVQKTEQK